MTVSAEVSLGAEYVFEAAPDLGWVIRDGGSLDCAAIVEAVLLLAKKIRCVHVAKPARRGKASQQNCKALTKPPNAALTFLVP